MCACNNPNIRRDALTRAVARLIAEHAKTEYAWCRGKRRATRAARAPPSTSGTRWGRRGARGKRQRATITPKIPSEVTSDHPRRPHGLLSKGGPDSLPAEGKGQGRAFLEPSKPFSRPAGKMVYREGGSLLTNLEKEPLQEIVRFLRQYLNQAPRQHKEDVPTHIRGPAGFDQVL